VAISDKLRDVWCAQEVAVAALWQFIAKPFVDVGTAKRTNYLRRNLEISRLCNATRSRLCPAKFETLITFIYREHCSCARGKYATMIRASTLYSSAMAMMFAARLDRCNLKPVAHVESLRHLSPRESPLLLKKAEDWRRWEEVVLHVPNIMSKFRHFVSRLRYCGRCGDGAAILPKD